MSDWPRETATSDGPECEWPRRRSMPIIAMSIGLCGFGIMLLGLATTGGAITWKTVAAAAMGIFGAVDGIGGMLVPGVRVTGRGLSWSESALVASTEIHFAEVRSWRRRKRWLRFNLHTGGDRRLLLRMLSERHRAELIAALEQRLGPPESDAAAAPQPTREFRRGALPPSGSGQWGR